MPQEGKGGALQEHLVVDGCGMGLLLGFTPYLL